MHTLRKDCIKHTKKWDKGQRHANVPHQPASELKTIINSWPFQKWGLDVIDVLPLAPGDPNFLIVVTDYFPKWVEVDSIFGTAYKGIIQFHLYMSPIS